MASQTTILVVDDDPGLRALVAATLEIEGHTVVTAPDGEVALHVIEEEEPALILLDKTMPGMDGPGLAKELAARGYNVPIVVISGSDGGKSFARDIRAQNFIRKPFKVPQLIDVVSEMISRFSDGDFGNAQPVAGG